MFWIQRPYSGHSRAGELKRRVLVFGSGSHRCTGAFLGEMVAVEMVSHWLNRFDLRVVPAGRKVRAVARPFTQPKGLQVEVLARRAGGEHKMARARARQHGGRAGEGAAEDGVRRSSSISHLWPCDRPTAFGDASELSVRALSVVSRGLSVFATPLGRA